MNAIGNATSRPARPARQGLTATSPILAAAALALFSLTVTSCASFMVNPDLAATRKANASIGQQWNGCLSAAHGSPVVTERVSGGTVVSRVREITVESDRVPDSLDGYRLVYVSDIHFMNRYSRARLDALVAEINARDPDAIVLGGDYTLASANVSDFARAASGLRADEGAYATLGNHDFFNGKARNASALRESGIVFLDGTAIETPRGLAIAGVGDVRDEIPLLKPLLGALPASSFAILSCHNPDLVETIDRDALRRFDLVLCGHTHGGQITLFGYAPVIPSAYGQRYRTGTIGKDGVPVIVSNGAGYSGERFRFRFCAPSDFLLITLRKPARTRGP